MLRVQCEKSEDNLLDLLGVCDDENSEENEDMNNVTVELPFKKGHPQAVADLELRQTS